MRSKLFLFLCFFFLVSSICFAQKHIRGIHDTTVFSPKLWKQDTLGKYGYKYNIVTHTQIIYDLYGKTIEEVEKYLGLPDYFCMKKPCEECMAYIYHYEFYSDNLPRGYVYVPKQKCEKYIDTGSAFIVEFSVETKRVTSVQVTIKN